MFISSTRQAHGIRTEQLRSASDFVRIWESIAELHRSVGGDPDVSLDPLHFLASIDDARPSRSVACWSGDELIGIVYARAHQFFGISLGYAVSGDFIGRGSLLCAPGNEAAVAQAAVECLLRSDIHSLQLRIDSPLWEWPNFPGCNIRQFTGRVAGDRLNLPADYEVFLSSLGKHTRRNIRYYTRRALAAGIEFVPEVSADEYADAVRHLCDVAEYSNARPQLESCNRMLALHQGKGFLLRNQSGENVAALCGFSKGGRFYLLAQVNDRRLPELSLSLVLRGHTIQHLMATRHKELQFVDGSSLSLGRFCATVDYQAHFIDRGGWLPSFMKSAFARLVDSAFSGKVLPNVLGTLSGSYLPEERLIARTALRQLKLTKKDIESGDEQTPDSWKTDAGPSPSPNAQP